MCLLSPNPALRCHCFCCCRYLIDISDYIPGDTDWCAPDSPAQDSTCEYHLPRKTRDMLDAIMGENFTGMENGEQDGRFIAGFAAEQLRAVGGGPGSGAKEMRHGYLHHANFVDRMQDDLGNKLSSLNSLWWCVHASRSGPTLPYHALQTHARVRLMLPGAATTN